MAVTKIGMRNAWFQVHKWIGLILAILIIPISITGAALVWHDALDEALNPARFAPTATAALPPSAYAAAALKVLDPGETVSQIRFGDGGKGAVVVSATRPPQPGAGRPVREMVWLDPVDAHVIDQAASDAGIIRVMHGLHGSLLIPGAGRQIVGWIGVAMLISSLSGLWLWWPTVGRWARGLRWRRHRNFDTNLHHMMGFWIALPLFVLSLTGAWISFPQFFAAISGGGGQQQRGPDRMALMRARPLAQPAQSPDIALARAQAIEPGALVSLTWPTDLKAEWTVSIKPEKGRPAEIKVDDARGTAAAGEQRAAPQSGIARTMRKIHDGTDMGLVWQVIIFLGGILPAILAITGIIMWARARSWRGELAARRTLQQQS